MSTSTTRQHEDTATLVVPLFDALTELASTEVTGSDVQGQYHILPPSDQVLGVTEHNWSLDNESDGQITSVNVDSWMIANQKDGSQGNMASLSLNGGGRYIGLVATYSYRFPGARPPEVKIRMFSPVDSEVLELASSEKLSMGLVHALLHLAGIAVNDSSK